MRVLMLTPTPPAPAASSAVALVAWAQLSFLRQRHEITVVTTAGPDPAEWEAVERLRDAGVEVRAHRRVMTTRAAGARRWLRDASRWMVSGDPMYVVWHHEAGVQRALDDLLREGHFDIVHVNDGAMARYSLRTRAPRLLVEIEVRAPRPPDWSRPLRGGIYRGALDELDWHRWRAHQRGVWSAMDRIEVFTERDARVMASLAPAVAPRVRVNAFGMALPAAAVPEREEEGSVLFVGNYMHAPNVDAARWLALEIMPLVRARHPDARLTLVGTDPRGAVRGLAGEGVTVRGWVPDVERAIERAAVVAAPVRIGGGQRMKVLQAMAMGRAVVTTPRGAEGLMIDGGPPPLLVADTAEEIAGAISALLDDRAARHTLGRRARAVAEERHSAEAYGRRIDAGYAALCPSLHPSAGASTR
ncbi:MAG TPA: glycosyltransferase family 4 protein [Gemmatimonadales bacterium]